MEVPPSNLSFYSITQWTCSAPGSLCEMPDSNPCPRSLVHYQWATTFPFLFLVGCQAPSPFLSLFFCRDTFSFLNLSLLPDSLSFLNLSLLPDSLSFLILSLSPGSLSFIILILLPVFFSFQISIWPWLFCWPLYCSFVNTFCGSPSPLPTG